MQNRLSTITKRITSFIISLLLIVSISPGLTSAQSFDFSPSFEDTEGHWAEDTIYVMYRRGVITELEPERFAPDRPITRLDFTEWVMRAMGEQPLDDPDLDFTDLHAIPQEARGDVARAVEKGLIAGFPDGRFDPEGTLTRAQMATILGRSLMELGVPAQSRWFQPFFDRDEIPDWALPAAAAVTERLVVGRPTPLGFEFAPGEAITRAEAATMLERFIPKYIELGGIALEPDPGIVPPDQFLIGGWYLGRDEHRGHSYQTVDRHGSRINLVMMGSYALSFHDDGYVISGGYDSDFLFDWSANRRDRAVLARITNDAFCRETASKIIHSEQHTQRALDVLQKILDRGYDGLDINFENVDPADRDALTRFMQQVYRRFGNDYLITMAVPAKVADNPNHGWSGAFDYRALAPNVDYLIPMAYDEHWSTARPGPVASIPWVERIINYTVSVVPREKILLGAPFYGYDWEDNDEPNRATGLRWPTALDRAREHGAGIHWDEVNQTPFFRYTNAEGTDRVVYFENERSLKARMQLVRDYGLAGVAFWRFGQEEDNAWRVIRDVLD